METALAVAPAVASRYSYLGHHFDIRSSTWLISQVPCPQPLFAATKAALVAQHTGKTITDELSNPQLGRLNKLDTGIFASVSEILTVFLP